MSRAPRLTLCAIVRNESSTIREMLASVEGLVDELCIVDTGSTDDTVAVCKEAGATVQHIDWRDDFSSARNASLKAATGNWILVLDADERVEPTHHDLIRSCLQNPSQAYYLRRLHYIKDTHLSYVTQLNEADPRRSLGAVGYYVTNDVRLFPNDQRILFQGVVHETVEPAIRNCPELTIVQTESIIHHIGPLFEKSTYQAKAAWYLELAKKALQSAPRDWRAWFHVGAELQGNNQIEAARDAYREAANLKDDVALIWRQLGVCLIALGDYQQALPPLRRASELDPSCPMTLNALGVALMECGFLNEAELCFTACQQLDPGSDLPQLNLSRLNALRTNAARSS